MVFDLVINKKYNVGRFKVTVFKENPKINNKSKIDNKNIENIK